jgi:hypothetical protein
MAHRCTLAWKMPKTPRPAPRPWLNDASAQKRMASSELTETFKTDNTLLSIGETAKRIHHFKKGFVGASTIDEKGRECTNWFIGEREVMISAYSFFTQSFPEEYIEILQDAVLLSITWTRIDVFLPILKRAI